MWLRADCSIAVADDTRRFTLWGKQRRHRFRTPRFVSEDGLLMRDQPGASIFGSSASSSLFAHPWKGLGSVYLSARCWHWVGPKGLHCHFTVRRTAMQWVCNTIGQRSALLHRWFTDGCSSVFVIVRSGAGGLFGAPAGGALTIDQSLHQASVATVPRTEYALHAVSSLSLRRSVAFRRKQ